MSDPNNNIDLNRLVVSDTHRSGSRLWSWKSFGWAMIGLALLSVGGYKAWVRFRPRTSVQVVQVVAATGTVKTGGDVFEAAGWIEPDPFPDYASTLIEGWITELPVVEGDSVKKGQLLAKLYDVDYKLALEKALAQVEALQAEAGYLDIQVKIDTNLLGAGAIDTLVLEKSKAEYARSKAHVKEAQLNVKLAQLNLDRCTIPSPIDGIVLQRFVSVGHHVNPMSHNVTLVSLYHPESIQVRVDVNLIDVEKAGIGTPCELRVESSPGRTFPGRVHRILHEADNQKNTVQFKVKIMDSGSGLKPEMLCRVRFLPPGREVEADTSRSLRFIPKSAVLSRGGTDYVFVVKGASPGLEARQIAVVLGSARKNDLVEVTSGLDLSSKVIVTGLSNLKDGEPVQIQGDY